MHLVLFSTCFFKLFIWKETFQAWISNSSELLPVEGIPANILKREFAPVWFIPSWVLARKYYKIIIINSSEPIP